MLERVRIGSYQSIQDADLAVEPFTVVVGASSSGKSATLRALRTLSFNSSSASFVTTGKKSSTVTASFDDLTVSLERGPSLSTYTLSDFILDAQSPLPQQYPKAGTSVPDDVREALRLPEVEGASLNFAFQFDKPFLLDEPGSKVAKVLGDLTNVTVIYEAVREANRRRLEASQKLKVRKTDVSSLTVALDAFRDLPEERRKMDVAEDAMAEAKVDEARATRLRLLTESTEARQLHLDELSARTASAPDVDTDVIQITADRVRSLRRVLESMTKSVREKRSLGVELSVLDATLQTQEQKIHDVLEENGTCPLCGSKTG